MLRISGQRLFVPLGCLFFLAISSSVKHLLSGNALFRERPSCYTERQNIDKLNLEPKNTPLTISLCIPAIPRDVDKGCIFRVVQSARLQTVPPTEIIIALSNSSFTYGSHASMALRESAGQIPLRLVRASELYVQGKSRNNAILAATSDIISFIDADDEMHPNRLEIIHHMFAKEKNLKMFLHGYTEEHDLRKWRKKELSSESGNMVGKAELCKSEARTRQQAHLDLLVHHAHVSLRHNMLGGVHFDESRKSYRSEDSLFVRAILADTCKDAGSKENILFLDSPLSYYETSQATCAYSNVSNSFFE